MTFVSNFTKLCIVGCVFNSVGLIITYEKLSIKYTFDKQLLQNNLISLDLTV
jgi:hypothetical protein